MSGNKNDLFSVYRKKVIPSIDFHKFRFNLTDTNLLIPLYMLMCKEMFLAILHVPLALGTETKL